MRWLLLLAVCCLAGCDAKDTSGLNIDLSQLNWQTAAIAILLLLINPGSIVTKLASVLSGIPFAEKLLRLLGLIKVKDESPDTLTQAEVLEAIVAIVNRMPTSPLRDQLAKLLHMAAQHPGEVTQPPDPPAPHRTKRKTVQHG